MIALPLDSGYATATDVGAAFPGTMDQISYWDASIQNWTTATDLGDPTWDGDFPVYPGMPLMVNALAGFNFYSMGALPATTTTYDLVVGLNTIMVPLTRSDLTTATEVGVSIGTVDQVSFWDALIQNWTTATDLGDPTYDGDFAVAIGMPLMVNSLSVTTWPSAKHSQVNTMKASRASK